MLALAGWVASVPPCMAASNDNNWRARKLGFLVQATDDVLEVQVDKEFIEAAGNRAWAKMLGDRYPGPWRRVVLKLDHCHVVNSTLLSEILHLREVYGRQNTEMVLSKPSERMMAMIEIMSLEALFTVE